jgi:oxygen-independent coproporphyrinogen III oxidase
MHNPWANVSTIYFGWWTPSILSLSEVEEILSLFPYTWPREVSFECNPEDVTEEYIVWLIWLGINRISLGIQSLNPITLQEIGRSSIESIFQALHILQNVALWEQDTFSLNIDFILWLPHVSFWETYRYIKELHKKFSCIKHTSVYMLENWLYPKDWVPISLSEAEMEKEYTDICWYFADIWWNHYEISNWSREGFESIHNIWYWTHENYRWFWLSATSYVSGKRWQNSSGFSWYYKQELDYSESLSQKELILEKMIYDIRTFSLESSCFSQDTLINMEQRGYISIKNGNIVLTPTWIFRENSIISSLLDATVAQW